MTHTGVLRLNQMVAVGFVVAVWEAGRAPYLEARVHLHASVQKELYLLLVTPLTRGGLSRCSAAVIEVVREARGPH